jgi:rubrerythrin
VGCLFLLTFPFNILFAVDTDILNYALTLEHLESTFYHQSLRKYSKEDFANAGYPSWVRDRFEQISAHEQTHVDFLSKALETKAVKPCEYKL